MGQPEPEGQDAESDDVRVRAFADDRDRINELRNGTERQPDVIRRLLDDYEGDGDAGSFTSEAEVEITPTLDEDALAEIKTSVQEAVGEGAGVDPDAIAEAVAERVDAPDTVRLEASERRAIAEEVAEVLQQ